MTAATTSAGFGLDRYRYRYSLPEMTHILARALRGFPVLRAGMRRGLISAQFKERIMLAVTEVNGCAVCSYAHTRWALEDGIDPAEVTALLNGDDAMIRPEEAKAIAFGQHYADTQGHPSSGAYREVVDGYGPDRARLIVAAIQVMMAGNVLGLPQSAALSRLRRRPYVNSSLGYEAAAILAPVVMVPMAAVSSLWLSREPGRNIDFAD